MTILVGQFVSSSLFSKVLNISKTLNNSGMKVIQLVYGGLAHHQAKYGAISWLDFNLRLTEICWRASLVQEKTQCLDFSSSTGITGKI